MYRLLFPLLLCMNAVNPAPQSKSDSDVTIVKIQPVLEDIAPEVTNKRRESRIENLPLTIPGKIDGTVSNGNPTNDTVSDGTLSNRKPSNGKPSDITASNSKPTDDTVSDGTLLIGKPIDGTSDETLPDLSVQNTEVSEQKTDLTESENKSDITQETQSRQGRNYNSDETTESFEIATEKYEEVTEEAKKSSQFPPKLSYFPKNYDRFSTNLLEKVGKRQFRSRCRCEKIWNCPKLQISVPRCPDEYFLCCF